MRLMHACRSRSVKSILSVVLLLLVSTRVGAISDVPASAGPAKDTASLLTESLIKLSTAANAALKQQLALSAPFMLAERESRIERLQEMPVTTDLELVAKYRRLLEAYRIELDFGKDIETYQSALRIGGKERLVDFLRVGQLALYYQTFDGRESGVWSFAEAKWLPLSDNYNTFVSKGLRIARKLEPPELMILPLFGLDNSGNSDSIALDSPATAVNAEIDAELSKRSALLSAIRENAQSLKAFYLQQAPTDGGTSQLRLLANLIDGKHKPTLSELQQMFNNLCRQLADQRRVSIFRAQVYAPTGLAAEQEVMNVGGFTLISQGRYLSYSDTDAHLLELTRQPVEDILNMAQTFRQTDAKSLAALAIDPSGGQILKLLIQVPNLHERIQQGGAVGYLVLVMGGLALLFSAFKFVRLSLIGKHIQQQLHSSVLSLNNPLGQCLSRLEQSTLNDEEALYLIVEESLSAQQSQLEKGLPFLKLVAAVAPMLGLLGTVTGMIETFQAIALHGSGDPKLMSGGISQALVTTVEGLVTAIPVLLLHSLLSGKSQSLAAMLEAHVSVALAQRLEQRHAAFDKTVIDKL